MARTRTITIRGAKLPISEGNLGKLFHATKRRNTSHVPWPATPWWVAERKLRRPRQRDFDATWGTAYQEWREPKPKDDGPAIYQPDPFDQMMVDGYDDWQLKGRPYGLYDKPLSPERRASSVPRAARAREG